MTAKTTPAFPLVNARRLESADGKTVFSFEPLIDRCIVSIARDGKSVSCDFSNETARLIYRDALADGASLVEEEATRSSHNRVFAYGRVQSSRQSMIDIDMDEKGPAYVRDRFAGLAHRWGDACRNAVWLAQYCDPNVVDIDLKIENAVSWAKMAWRDAVAAQYVQDSGRCRKAPPWVPWKDRAPKTRNTEVTPTYPLSTVS